MLVELRAENYAVIDHAIAVFGPGLNLLTGETGAGKTLLLGALDLCLGGDGSTTRAAIAPDMRAAAVFDRNGEREVVQMCIRDSAWRISPWRKREWDDSAMPTSSG